MVFGCFGVGGRKGGRLGKPGERRGYYDTQFAL